MNRRSYYSHKGFTSSEHPQIRSCSGVREYPVLHPALWCISLELEIVDENSELNNQFDNSGNLIIADFQEYAADLARILEKNGLVKVKGNSIKWKHQ